MRLRLVAVSVASFNLHDPPFTVRELADEFLPYGTLSSVQVWQPGFAVVEFEDQRNALNAAAQLNGRHGWILKPLAIPHTSADHFQQQSVVVHQRERGGRSGCYECGKPGHIARDCLLLRRPGTRTNASSNPRNRSTSSDSSSSNRSTSSDSSNRSRSPTLPTRNRRRSPSPPTPRNRRSPEPRSRRRSRVPSPPRNRRRSPGYGHRRRRSYDDTAGSSAQNLKGHSPD